MNRERNLADLAQQRLQFNEPDIPARVGLELVGWKPDSPLKRAYEWLTLDFDYAVPPEVISTNNYDSPMGGEFYVSDDRGMWSLFEDFYAKFSDKILLNKAVTKIKYHDDGVLVTTSDGQEFAADYGLCTFSNGVLSSDMVNFDPPLPSWKRDAISKIRMAYYTKIFLKFPYKFWDDSQYILLATKWPQPFHVFQDLKRPGLITNDTAMLYAAVVYEDALRIESQSDLVTKEEAMVALRKMYGPGIPNATG